LELKKKLNFASQPGMENIQFGSFEFKKAVCEMMQVVLNLLKGKEVSYVKARMD
jgi:hypothetical protein